MVDNRRLEGFDNDNINKNGIFYLTGSQAFQTMSNVTESLAGRVGILSLYGLTRREIEQIEETFFIPEKDLLQNKVKTEKLNTIELFEKFL